MQETIYGAVTEINANTLNRFDKRYTFIHLHSTDEYIGHIFHVNVEFMTLMYTYTDDMLYVHVAEINGNLFDNFLRDYYKGSAKSYRGFDENKKELEPMLESYGINKQMLEESVIKVAGI